MKKRRYQKKSSKVPRGILCVSAILMVTIFCCVVIHLNHTNGEDIKRNINSVNDKQVVRAETNEVTVPPNTLVTAPMASETDPTSAPKEVNTQHLFQELDENVRMDAEVIIPEKEAYSTYTLKRVDSDPDRLFGIFCPEGYGSYTIDDRSALRYFESSGKKLVVRKDSISYSAYNIDWGENPMQDVHTLMYYYTKNHSQAEPCDLSFMTVAEMEHFCRDILNKLGIAFEPELLKCATLTGQELMDFQQELFGTGGIYAENGFPPTNLTAATDTCYLEFSFACDGIPLLGSEEPGVASAVSMMPTPSVTATMMINTDGLQECDVYFPCTIESESQPQTILTPDEAVAALKDKYDLEIHTSTIEFCNAWLEYLPVVNEDSVTLTPYWCFVTRRTSEENSDGTGTWHTEYANAERFNAITGKDLAYGG